jgi:hypothetical protein
VNARPSTRWPKVVCRIELSQSQGNNFIVSTPKQISKANPAVRGVLRTGKIIPTPQKIITAHKQSPGYFPNRRGVKKVERVNNPAAMVPTTNNK